MAKFCMNCGTANDDNSTFCAKCGSPFNTVKAAPTSLSKGFGITSLVLGIVGLVSVFPTLLVAIYVNSEYTHMWPNEYAEAKSVFTVMAVLVGLMAVIALGMGIFNIVTKHSSGKTVAGVVLGSITFVFFLLSIIIFAAA